MIYDVCVDPEGERSTGNQRLVVLRPVGDRVKRLAHDADLKGGDQITVLSVSSLRNVLADLAKGYPENAIEYLTWLVSRAYAHVVI